MSWLKRNLYLVLGSAIALALLGLAGFYLFSNIQKESQVTQELDQKTAQLTELVNRKVHPGTEEIDNIGATKKEVVRLQQEVLSSAQQYFEPLPIPPELNMARFNEYLANTIHGLRKEAEQISVKLPPQYSFSFAAQERSTYFPPETLAPLGYQVAEVRAICKILFDAKISRLLYIQRAAVSTNEPADSPDYLSHTIATNEITGAVSAPYEVSFVGFSAELAKVLDKLANSPHGFLVKFVAVEKANIPEETSEVAPVIEYAMPAPRSPYAMDPELAKRYGLIGPGAGGRFGANPYSRYGGLGGGRFGGFGGPRYGYGRANSYEAYAPPAPSDQLTTTAHASTKPGVFLDEQPLQITIALEVIKVLPPVSK